LGLVSKNNLIVGCVYKIMDEKREDHHDQFLSTLMHKVLDEFDSEFGEYHQSQKDYLSNCFQTNEPIKPEITEHFAQFSARIPTFIS